MKMLADLGETAQTMLAAVIGMAVPAFWRWISAVFRNPSQQDKRWETHELKHEDHTKEHGRIDGRIAKAFEHIDALRAQNQELRERLARVEAKSEAA